MAYGLEGRCSIQLSYGRISHTICSNPEELHKGPTMSGQPLFRSAAWCPEPESNRHRVSSEGF